MNIIELIEVFFIKENEVTRGHRENARNKILL